MCARTLAAADAAGLIGFDPADERGVILMPALWRAVDRFIALSMERHDLTAMIALRALDAPEKHP
ncbi:hypothetical protein ACFO8O_01535 [Hephaestia sp. GCM10023244]|uniref:hypothetical protein n=1 Tax=unclassified Hephaestia TaxID=2631281 RepID=UPI002077432C|nr:hypothetical protein [Hephaestia sp. MAHUQ-44]MCM8729653.1 hypothetical protein [Hephaestia sp. MAHUQ-44]